MKQNIQQSMRKWHRSLGYFLAGIMAVYAISGVVLVFRNTDFLKKEVVVKKTLEKGMTYEQLKKAIKKKNIDIKEQGDLYVFKGGTYEVLTGAVTYTKKELPYVLGKMTKLHKANTNSSLYFLNISFGFALLFFVISAFWMYSPKLPIFKKSMYFAIGGVVLTLVLLFV